MLLCKPASFWTSDTASPILSWHLIPYALVPWWLVTGKGFVASGYRAVQRPRLKMSPSRIQSKQSQRVCPLCFSPEAVKWLDRWYCRHLGELFRQRCPLRYKLIEQKVHQTHIYCSRVHYLGQPLAPPARMPPKPANGARPSREPGIRHAETGKAAVQPVQHVRFNEGRQQQVSCLSLGNSSLVRLLCGPSPASTSVTYC